MPDDNMRGLPGDYDYGVLNSIDVPKVGDSLDLAGADPWLVLRNAAEKQFIPDAISNTGPYRGIVLRVEITQQIQYKNVDDAAFYVYHTNEGGDAAKSEGYPASANPPDLVKIKVRIPELHAHLPIPKAWGDLAEGNHHAIIDMYPTYTAQSDMLPAPRPGDIVWVDYTNKNDFTDPIYIRPVTERQYFIQELQQILGKNAFDPCVRTTSGGTNPGDSTPAANSSGTQNYPKGARKEPVGETEIIESTEFPPNKRRKPTLERLASASDLKVKGWVGRLQENGDREVVILAPQTTTFENEIEIIYWIHGGGSWFSANTPKFLIQNLKTLSGQQRNVVLVYMQLKWAKGISPFNPEKKGGNLRSLHGKTLEILKRHFSNSPEVRVGFITVAAHSKGGHGLYNAARSGQLRNLAPDKITCADSEYVKFGAPVISGVWDNYVSAARKNVELNLLCISPNRRPDNYPEENQVRHYGDKVVEGDNGKQPREAMQKLMQTKLGTRVGTKKVSVEYDNSAQEVITDIPLDAAATKAYVTYVPLMLTHGDIAIKHGILFNGAGPQPAKQNKENSVKAPTNTDSPTGAATQEQVQQSEAN